MADESIIGNGHMAISALMASFGVKKGASNAKRALQPSSCSPLQGGFNEMETRTLGWGAAAGQIDNSNSREPGPL